MSLYSVSEEAYEGLIRQARQLGYVSPWPLERVHGLGPYLAAISQCTFRDTRPAEYRDMDRQLLEQSVLPIWYDDNFRQKRRFRMKDETRARLVSIALDFGISNFHRSDSVEREASVLGALLEAIGLGYLTPDDPPPCTARRASRYRPQGFHNKRTEIIF